MPPDQRSSLLCDKAMQQATNALMRALLDDMAKYYDDPLHKQLRADAQARWDALPWYVKAWRKSPLKETWWRVKIAFDVLRRGDRSTWLGD